MSSEPRYMRFNFEGNHYVTNMTSKEISGDSDCDSPNHNIPIKLPDGRFVKVSGWRRSSPPKPCPKMFIVEDKEYPRYAIAQLIDTKKF